MKPILLFSTLNIVAVISAFTLLNANSQTTQTDKAKVTKKAEMKESARLAICQYCFWTGELKIGAIEGVTETEAGFMDSREVTLVKYDPKVTTVAMILKQAKADGVATGIYLDEPDKLPGSKQFTGYRAAPKHDQKKQIQGTIFANLTLTNEQATKVNAYARSNPQKALTYLTPEQIKQLKR